jgi:hypothetical protein
MSEYGAVSESLMDLRIIHLVDLYLNYHPRDTSGNFNCNQVTD